MASGCGQIVDWAKDHVYARPMGGGHMMDYVPLHIAAQQVQKTKAAGFIEGFDAAAKICDDAMSTRLNALRALLPNKERDE